MFIYKGKFARRAYLNWSSMIVRGFITLLFFIYLILQLLNDPGSIWFKVFFFVMLILALVSLITLKSTNDQMCVFSIENDMLTISIGSNTVNRIKLPTKCMQVKVIEPEGWFSSRVVSRLLIYDNDMRKFIAISEYLPTSNQANPTSPERKPSDYLSMETGVVDTLQKALDSYCQK